MDVVKFQGYGHWILSGGVGRPGPSSEGLSQGGDVGEGQEPTLPVRVTPLQKSITLCVHLCIVPWEFLGPLFADWVSGSCFLKRFRNRNFLIWHLLHLPLSSGECSLHIRLVISDAPTTWVITKACREKFKYLIVWFYPCAFESVILQRQLDI